MMGRRLAPVEREFGVLHLFCGIGGGALGFGAARAEIGGLSGRFVNVGGIDCDPLAIEDYTRLTGTPGTVLDLFTAEDYADFHGRPPPDGWREAMPSDIAKAATRTPDVVFLSPPCQGFSGLLSRRKSESKPYRALNRLVARGVWLTLEAFAERPKLIILENVPRILQRGRDLLDRVIALLNAFGYATQETVHNCGEVGGLAANRRRYLLVARHVEQVAPFLYEPPNKGMRPLGDEILRLPLPFDPAAGPMHALPKLDFKTWLRLALVPAGGDWRDLRAWAPDTFRVDRTPFNNVYRVLRLDEPAPTVTSGATPGGGGYSIVDPRLSDAPGRHTCKYHVADPEQPARTVTSARVGSGALSTVDPRLSDAPGRHTTKYHVANPELPARAVTGTMDIQAGALSTVDPRMSLPENSVTLRVRGLDAPAATVVGRSSVWDSGGQAVPDPRPTASCRNGTLGVGRLDEPGQTIVASSDIWTPGSGSTPDPRVGKAFAGTYGVVPLDEPAGTVTASARESTGAFSVPDVRVGRAFEGTYGVASLEAPAATVTAKAGATSGRFSVPDVRVLGAFSGAHGVVELSSPAPTIIGESWPTNGPFTVPETRLSSRPDFWPEWVPIIISPHDGCMHRPLTTLELYALQGFNPAGAPKLAERRKGKSSVARWRKAIGNAVPPPAAQAYGETMLRTLLANRLAQQMLPSTPVWVAPPEFLNRVLRWFAPDDYPAELPCPTGGLQ